MPPSHTPRKPPTWCEKNAKPNSMASQRVPNISATSAEVGGTVESHSRPIAAPKASVAGVLGGSTTNATIASARVRLRHAIAEPAGGERAEDVEDADHGEGPAADLSGQSAVDQIGRQMHSDEGELETAGEEAE